ncbi:hypothetical protein ANHYDRO_01021, partial [Anaerococcus hydrogenalis DSM 7454]
MEKTKTVINKDNTNKNPKTGVASLSTVLSSLGISLSALGFSKKKEKINKNNKKMLDFSLTF